ncbi:hypothetical protein ACVWY3_005866 [Bradyrhizobium sp. USDA 4486]
METVAPKITPFSYAIALPQAGRGEDAYTRGMLAGRTSRACAASLMPALAAPKP